jgi:hypothetical protein
MYTLFAYTRDPSQRIVRFEVDRTVQAEMTAYLEAQAEYFDREREEINFDGKYKPDDHELLVISEFEDIDNLAFAVQHPITIPIADPSQLEFEQIKALFFGKIGTDGNISVYLQSFDRRKLITDTGFSIFHSQNVYKKIEGTGLTLDNKVSAKLEGTSLKFFSFFHVSRMFDLTEYYQEATDNDIQEFSSLAQVAVSDQRALIEISDNWVRRKLWLIKQSGILERVQPNDIRRIAGEFGININFEVTETSEKMVMPTDKKELKTLLRFLDEDYYKSPLSNTNFISNSKRPVEQS